MKDGGDLPPTVIYKIRRQDLAAKAPEAAHVVDNLHISPEQAVMVGLVILYDFSEDELINKLLVNCGHWGGAYVENAWRGWWQPDHWADSLRVFEAAAAGTRAMKNNQGQ